MTFKVTRLVEWGDCDAAGIVYYPNYYRWMDAAFHALTATLGFDQRVLMERHGLLGTPLVDTGCSFAAPASFGDELTIAPRLAAIGTSSIALAYAITRGPTAIANGRETRVFVASVGDRIEKAPIPAAVRAMLEPLLRPEASAAG
jgi:YbgC/YbaW family acyl-CoA thioester hydrolase